MDDNQFKEISLPRGDRQLELSFRGRPIFTEKDELDLRITIYETESGKYVWEWRNRSMGFQVKPLNTKAELIDRIEKSEIATSSKAKDLLRKLGSSKTIRRIDDPTHDDLAKKEGYERVLIKTNEKEDVEFFGKLLASFQRWKVYQMLNGTYVVSDLDCKYEIFPDQESIVKKFGYTKDFKNIYIALGIPTAERFE